MKKFFCCWAYRPTIASQNFTFLSSTDGLGFLECIAYTISDKVTNLESEKGPGGAGGRYLFLSQEIRN